MIRPAQHVPPAPHVPLRDAESARFANPKVASGITDAVALTSSDGRNETSEQEITRLTWLVLDGGASLADRQRLAELVQNQHRPRILSTEH